MIQSKKKYQFKIIQPENQRPSLMSRLGRRTSVDGLGSIVLFFIAIKKVLKFGKNDKKTDYIAIGENEITSTIGGYKQVVKLCEIENMELHFNSESYIENSDYKEHSKVQFKNKEEEVVFFIVANHWQARGVCTRLYDNRVPFREFKNGRRVFLGQSKNYKEIQELKKKYHLKW